MQETPLSELIQQRIKKLENLRNMGIEPYDGVFEPQHSTYENF
ncbi:Lysyl-tRNA synthetase (class II) [Thermodesulfovibrio sp. N1]|nr:Lysyl-tRNA synthetase (class II) [Thermodesulfovibrio sp. N1]